MSDRLFEAPAPTADAERPGVAGADAPLAARMRPRVADELVGQDHLLAEGSSLRRALEGEPHSMVFYGPPGTGKTTIARLIARAAKGAFEELSAVAAGSQQVREMLERAWERRRAGRRTIFFLDEIHRFNKAQQDALLPAVEEGLVTLIGATTENPYFEVNSALLSRCQVYELRGLTEDAVEVLLERALADSERGLAPAPRIAPDALELLAGRVAGDARAALRALELAAETVGADSEIDLAAAEDALQRRAVRYDKGGDRHYDLASAWIKATRGSDVDASIYYLAGMLEGGEDPRFIARRMVIFASEDIGNADPRALMVATAAGAAVDRVGMPECALNLSQATAYLALAPKSNAATVAISRARALIRERGLDDPPDYLRDSHYPGARELGRGVGYEYPHNRPDALSSQPLLPDSVSDQRFFEPTDRGYEAKLRERMAEIQRRR
ncbi:MAG: replication-associated recombination protein A [Solirubrobacterales bacterium]